MVRPINVNDEEAEKAMHKPIASIKDKTSRIANQAAKEVSIKHRRSEGERGKRTGRTIETTRGKRVGNVDRIGSGWKSGSI
jgi:uncharacterized protein YcfJ